MGRIKKYEEWITEDFAAVGIAPEGNVIGMGNATPPSSTSVGSGDMWPSLGAPATATGTVKKKRRKKRKKKKIDEGSSDLHPDSDISYLSDATLSGAAIDSKVSTNDWIDFFSTIYTVDADFLSQSNKEKLREIFGSELMSVWVTFDWEEPGETEGVIAYQKDRWDILATEVDGRGGSNGVTRILTKAYTDQELKDNYEELLDEVKTNNKLSEKEFNWLFSLLKEEDKEKLKGHSAGKGYGV
jgi:hypothetical protein